MVKDFGEPQEYEEIGTSQECAQVISQQEKKAWMKVVNLNSATGVGFMAIGGFMMFGFAGVIIENLYLLFRDKEGILSEIIVLLIMAAFFCLFGCFFKIGWSDHREVVYMRKNPVYRVSGKYHSKNATYGSQGAGRRGMTYTIVVSDGLDMLFDKKHKIQKKQYEHAEQMEWSVYYYQRKDGVYLVSVVEAEWVKHRLK